MEQKSDTTHMVHKQTLYIAILVSITFGFMVGATYTSFKLANDSGGRAQVSGKPPHESEPARETQVDAEARMGAQVLKLEAFLKENPDNAEAWAQLGNLFFDSNRFADAIEAYEKSLLLAPGNPSVLTDLGVMHRRNKAPEKAIAAFDMAIEVKPDFETARFNKGIVLMHDLNDLPGAIKAWEALVDVNPMAQAPDGQLVNTLIQGLKDKQK